jgi:hypothetical protein
MIRTMNNELEVSMQFAPLGTDTHVLLHGKEAFRHSDEFVR